MESVFGLARQRRAPLELECHFMSARGERFRTRTAEKGSLKCHFMSARAERFGTPTTEKGIFGVTVPLRNLLERDCIAGGHQTFL